MLQGMAGRRERHDGRVRGVRCVVYLVGLCVMLLAVAGAAEAGDWQRMPSRSPEPYDHVVSDARGNTVAVWSGQDLSGQNTFVRAAFRLAGGSWGPAEVLQATSTPGISLSEVRVAMSPEGLAVATWVRRDSADSTPETDEVWAAVKPVGGASFGAPTKLSVPGDPPGATQPDVAVGAHGDAMVVWSTGDARCSIDCRGIRAATRPSDGSFQQLGTLSPTGERAEQPRVALDAGGRATVVWRTFAAPGQQVLYTAQRGATGPFDAPQIAATCDCAVGGPQLAVDRDGTAHLVIRASAGAVLWTTRPWGKSFQALREIAPSSAAAEPAVSVAPDGTALVVLARTERILEWRARPPGGDFGRAYYLDRTYFGQTEPSHADHLSVPTLAVSDGQTVATWTPLPHWESSLGRYVLNDAAVRVARYDSTAPDPNLIQNDGFETGLWEWNASGSGAGTVMSREEGGHSGGWAARLANTGTSPASCVLNDAPVPIAPGSDYLQTGSGVFTLGLWVRADAAGQTLRLRLREYSSGALVGSKSTTVTLSTAWQKASFTYTPAAPGRSTLDVDAYVSGAAPGTCFMADDVSLTFAPTPAAPPAQPPPDPGLVDNAGFEADLAGWNTSGSAPGISLARVAGGHSGDRAASVDNSATTAGTCVLNDAPNIVATTAPGRYTAALWVRAETAGKTLRLRLREYDKTTRSLLGGQSMPVELTTSWQKVTVSYVPSAPGASALDLNAYVTDAASGNCFVADDAAVSLGPVDPEPDLVPNPGFESGLWRWNTSGSAAGVTVSRVPGGHSGDWTAKLANTATTAGTCALNDAPNVVSTTASGTYTTRCGCAQQPPGRRSNSKCGNTKGRHWSAATPHRSR
jgi:hypothetical protein